MKLLHAMCIEMRDKPISFNLNRVF